eukprot:TRINITY_DN31115_c0_g1_i1.p1 TRINITY_DN31115_c0_g1~~TRINITY_DN31115_c0_g1_i1.p1  ORF type:complete len:380 (-),score=54.73 TRINITY_DN31115_c0_g1_i1:388-1503(-)
MARPHAGPHCAPHSKAHSLDDLYAVGEFLAAGGFSRVHKAVHRATGRECALKIMERSMLTGVRQTMVTRENEILRRCRHPNILEVYEVIETPTQIALALQLIKGGDLYEYIVQRKRLTEGDAAKITKGILKAVQYIHDANPPVVHRDIKPENILIENVADERIYLSDFGLAKILLDSNSLFCTPGGTSFYLPPEIVEGIKKHGFKPRPTNLRDMKALDLWSTGVVVYILLCGRPPFRGGIKTEGERQQRLEEIAQGVPFPPDKWAGVSDVARDMVTRLLEPNPAKRITAAQALAHPWLTYQYSPNLLMTPSVLTTEYQTKQEFHDDVEGATKVVQKKVIAWVDEPQKKDKHVVLRMIGDLAKKRKGKHEPQ